MHAVSSDDEPPTNLEPEERYDPKEIRKRLRKQTRNNKNSTEKTIKMKKRVKKIIKKLRCEAFECDNYNKSSKSLVELHQLILQNKVNINLLILQVTKHILPVGKSNPEFNEETIKGLKLELNRLEHKTKNLKSVGYYEDQIYFHNTEKRFRSKTQVRN